MLYEQIRFFYEFLFGVDVDKIQKHTYVTQEGVMEFSGTCASPGNVIAEAIVLHSPKEIGKMKEGRILVTGMTTPEFVPAIGKAIAIITNEGGITSHAAIVSREFGIPCVVGTNIATKRISDGDLVEIHAASGVIKVIKKAKG